MEMSFERNIVSRGWHVYRKKMKIKMKLKMKIAKRQQRLIHLQLFGQSKEKINLFLLLLGISQERFRGLQNSVLTTVEKLKRSFFFTLKTIPNPIKKT